MYDEKSEQKFNINITRFEEIVRMFSRLFQNLQRTCISTSEKT